MSRCDKDGNTILHLATMADHERLVNAIIQQEDCEQIDKALKKKNTRKKTPRHLMKSRVVRRVIEWSAAQSGFYHLHTAPRALVMYTTAKRPGAAAEKSTIVDCLTELGIIPAVLVDPTENEMMAIIRSEQQSSISALMVFLMSHGDSGVVWAKDKPVPIHQLLMQMNSPRIEAKPKVGATA